MSGLRNLSRERTESSPPPRGDEDSEDSENGGTDDASSDDPSADSDSVAADSIQSTIENHTNYSPFSGGPRILHLDAPPTYPRNPGDIVAVVAMLRRLSLPDELVTSILHYAAYDGILFQAASNEMRRASGGELSRASRREPCVSTPPLRYLGRKESEQAINDAEAGGETVTAADTSLFNARGRITRVNLTVTGRSQGWTSSPDPGNWSWFEAATVEKPGLHNMRFDGGVQVRNPRRWAHNPSQDREHAWHTHHMEYDADDPHSVCPDNLLTLFQDLRDGDCLCIIPMAQFPGWTNEVRCAKVEVFVEVYR